MKVTPERCTACGRTPTLGDYAVAMLAIYSDTAPYPDEDTRALVCRECGACGCSVLTTSLVSLPWTHRKSGVRYEVRGLTIREADLVLCVLYHPYNGYPLGSGETFCRPYSEFRERFTRVTP